MILYILKLNNDEVLLQNLVPEIRPMIQNGLSTVKTDLLHHYVMGLVAMTQKNLRALKH